MVSEGTSPTTQASGARSVVLSLAIIGVGSSLVLSGMFYLPLRLMDLPNAAPLAWGFGLAFGLVLVILAITNSSQSGGSNE